MAAPAISSDVYRGGRTRVITITQSGANNGSVAFEIPRALAALSAQLYGTIAAGTIAIEGSNDGTNYVALPTAVSFSAAGLKSVAAIDLGYRYYRATAASMDVTNSLTLTVVAKHF